MLALTRPSGEKSSFFWSSFMYQPPQPEQLYTVGEAAKVAACSPRKIWRDLATGRLPAVKHGRHTRIKASDLTAFIQALPYR